MVKLNSSNLEGVVAVKLLRMRIMANPRKKTSSPEGMKIRLKKQTI